MLPLFSYGIMDGTGHVFSVTFTSPLIISFWISMVKAATTLVS